MLFFILCDMFQEMKLFDIIFVLFKIKMKISNFKIRDRLLHKNKLESLQT
jgi:hypothetical protein